MEVVIDMPNGHKYKIKQIDSNTCWRVFKYNDSETGKNGVAIKHRWQPLEMYAHDVEYAVKLVVQLAMKEDDSIVQVGCSDCVSCELKKTIKKIAKEAKVDVQ